MIKRIALIGLFLWLRTVISCEKQEDAAVSSCQPFPWAKLPPGFCAYTYASGLNAPRQIITVSNGDVLVLEKGANKITVLWNNGQSRAQLVYQEGLDHAIRYHDGYLYASHSGTTVVRWRYTPGQRTSLGAKQDVVQYIPCCHHTTRAIEFDASGNMYVQVGSKSNLDSNTQNARIHMFSSAQLNSAPVSWWSGSVWAHGLRNAVSLRLDERDRLWAVEAERDNLQRQDVGGDIHNDNPCEELNLLDTRGKFYGYPYCFSAGVLQNTEPGTQFADPNFMNDGVHTDAWCRNAANVQKPALCFAAHTTPMDVYFWSDTAFPAKYRGAFVSFRGSWNSNPPVGYYVRYVPLDSNGMPKSSAEFLRYNKTGVDKDNNWPHRFTGLTKATCTYGQCLLVASEMVGTIIAIGYGS